ncbi:hypothetical protein C9374_008364 [Naegleria lovaniensis]|uniref:AB hydrolase-1 domain-containing protein n=1 Tax=Naegleria lovaniensis TaxID=51637 RepID=A0AA88KHI2_NAELO|nr:uncharacterized protein C9374_008364 [Naegleria lovaniensis]KAG2378221.1 hypothetical protein C9374_008364 [Naegleria lovaniensis]
MSSEQSQYSSSSNKQREYFNEFRKKKRESFFKRHSKTKLLKWGVLGFIGYYGLFVCQKPWVYSPNQQVLNNADAFQEHLKRTVPNFNKRFCPTPWLINAHAQTTFGGAVRHIIDDQDESSFKKKRNQYEFEDGAIINLDWFEPSESLTNTASNSLEASTSNMGAVGRGNQSNYAQSGRKSNTTIFIIPGLSGGTNAVGVKHLISSFVKAGYRCVVMDYKSVSPTEPTTIHHGHHTTHPVTPEGEPVDLDQPNRNHSPSTHVIPGLTHTVKDIRNVIQLVRKEVGPDETLVGVGMSLGANTLLTYLSEHVGKNAPKYQGAKKLKNHEKILPNDDHDESRNEFAYAISIGNPFDLNAATLKLQSNLFQRLIYDKAYAEERFMCYERNKGLLPEEYVQILSTIRSTRDLDDKINRHLSNPKFDSVEEFYNFHSCKDKLKNITIPTICINALDDPISTYEAIPFEEFLYNKKLMLVTTLRGGHIASLDGFIAPNKESWLERTSVQVVNSMNEWQESVKKYHKIN